MVSAIPTPAHAEKACCCKQDIAQGCTEAIIDATGIETCPPDFPRYEPGYVPDGQACGVLGDLQREAGGETGPRSWVSSILPGGAELIPAACRGDQRTDTGSPPCGVLEMLQVLVNVSKLMLALLGTAAFAMFVYGGLVFLTSAGNQERVTSGRRILTNAALGILVVLIAWSLVNLVVTVISAGRGGLGEIGNVFDRKWSSGP